MNGETELLSSRLEAERRGTWPTVVQAERRDVEADVKVLGRNGRRWPARQWSAARRDAIVAAVEAGLAAGVRQIDIAASLGVSKGFVGHVAASVPHRRRRGQRAVAESIKADPQLSDREHGRRTGVSDKTATKVRDELEKSAEIPHFSERIDPRTGVSNKTAAKVRDELEKGEEIPHLPYRENPQGRPQPATKVRDELEGTAEIPQLNRTVGADGKQRPAGKRRTATVDDTTINATTGETDPDRGAVRWFPPSPSGAPASTWHAPLPAAPWRPYNDDHAANVARRNMSTGARAMATALVLADDGRRIDGKWDGARSRSIIRGSSSTNSESSWVKAMTQAGVVLDFAPDLATPVVNGELALDAAHRQAVDNTLPDGGRRDREHGRRTGVSNKTAAKVRDELEGREEIPHVSERQDTIGRSQPAAKRRTVADTTIDTATGETDPGCGA